MATKIVYEPQYILSGWFDDGGMSMYSWFDRDIAGTVIPLVRAEVSFFIDLDVFAPYTPPPITVQVLPPFFIDVDTIFQPMSVRALTAPDQALKNEIRRVR